MVLLVFYVLVVLLSLLLVSFVKDDVAGKAIGVLGAFRWAELHRDGDGGLVESFAEAVVQFADEAAGDRVVGEGALHDLPVAPLAVLRGRVVAVRPADRHELHVGVVEVTPVVFRSLLDEGL